MQTLTATEKTQRQKALTDWYTQMGDVDPGKRESMAIPLAQKVIADSIRTTKSDLAIRLQGNLDRFKADKDPSKMNATELKEFNDGVASYQRKITAAQAEAARQTQ
jgi:uncharacterized protein YdaT